MEWKVFTGVFAVGAAIGVVLGDLGAVLSFTVPLAYGIYRVRLGDES